MPLNNASLAYCPQCAAELTEDASTCPNCRAVLDADGGWRPLQAKPKARTTSRIKIAAWLVGTPVLLFASLVAYVHIANWFASRPAAEFCAKARPGEPIAPLLAKGAGWTWRPIHDPEHSRYAFIFPGAFLFDKAICTVTVAGDKVLAAEVRMFYD
jgi:hypothetical protein